MTPGGLALTLAALGSLAGAAALLSARSTVEPAATPVAGLLGLLLRADVARLALGAVSPLLGPPRPPGEPYAGLARAAFHLGQALHLLWPLGCAGVAAALWTRAGAVQLHRAVAAWLVLSAMLALAYPGLRGERLLSTYRGVQAAAALASLAAVLLGSRPRRFRPGRAHLCALLLLAGCAAELAGPYLTAEVGAWWTAQVTWIFVLGAVGLVATGRPRWATPAAS